MKHTSNFLLAFMAVVSTTSLAAGPDCQQKAIEIAKSVSGAKGLELATFEKVNSDRESDGLESWLVTYKSTQENASFAVRVVLEKFGECYFKGATVVINGKPDKDVISQLSGK